MTEAYQVLHNERLPLGLPPPRPTVHDLDRDAERSGREGVSGPDVRRDQDQPVDPLSQDV